MTKVKNPLFGIDAQGSVGSAITYTRRRGQNIAEKKPTLPYFLTLPVQYQRWLYQDYAYLWRQQTPTTKQVYASAGVRFGLTGFQYWMKYQLTNLPDIAGWWKLDSIAGGVTPDSSRNGNHGSVIGAILGPGAIGNCLIFDGIDDEVDCGNDPTIQLTDDFTLMVLNRPDTPGLVCDMAGKLKLAAGEPGFALWKSANNKYGFRQGDGVTTGFIASDSAYPAIEFHHVTARRQAGLNNLFVDGVKQTGSNNHGVIDSGLNFFIGRIYANAAPYNPTTNDNVILLDRALDDTEIARWAERRYAL